jgi:hypothetical protein
LLDDRGFLVSESGSSSTNRGCFVESGCFVVRE